VTWLKYLLASAQRDLTGCFRKALLPLGIDFRPSVRG
jgi:hypothetical protein